MNVTAAQKLKVRIEKISLGGDGIARAALSPQDSASQIVIFVPYTAVGDEVEIEITEIKKNYARGRVIQIIHPGPDRTQPPCPYFFVPSPLPARGEGKQLWCGGCDFQHLNYEAQLQTKQRFIKETLEKIAGIPSHYVQPVIKTESDEEWRYRNKIQIPFGKIPLNSGKISAGFYSPGSHEIVPIEDCLIHSESMMALTSFVREKMNQWNLEVYSEKTHRGWLRHLLIRESEKKMLVVFVTAKDFFPMQKKWIEEIKTRFPNVVGVLQNVNPEKTNVILGRKWRRLFGQDFLIEKMGGFLKLKISASSFFQVNTAMAKKLYETVRNEASGGFLLLDLYCGVGGMALACAPLFQKVIGVDEIFSSIQNAIENQKLNGLSNCRFYCKDVRLFLKENARDFNPQQSITVVLDPPRSGCDAEVLKQAAKLKPQKIIYVSCEPSTLARDLKFLCAEGFQVLKVQPLDMFPQSSHVESVTVLKRK